MPRAGLGTDRVVAEAESVADELGIGGVTLAVVAARLGVKAPSLYKHITSLDAVQQLVAMRARVELAGVLAAAGSGTRGAEAVRALSTAYRAWARQHPGRYPATVRAPNPTDPLDVATSERVVAVVYSALAGFGINGDALIDATRMIRATLHGFVALEAAHGFGLPRDIDRSFEQTVEALVGTLRDWPST